MFSRPSSAPRSFRISTTSGLPSQTVLPSSCGGSSPAAPSAVEETAGGIHRAVDRQSVLLAGDVVFLAVAGGGVDCAGALLQRDVVGKDAERIAVR